MLREPPPSPIQARLRSTAASETMDMPSSSLHPWRRFKDRQVGDGQAIAQHQRRHETKGDREFGNGRHINPCREWRGVSDYEDVETIDDNAESDEKAGEYGPRLR